ncbi:MAG: hypothetical protein R3315_05285 [Woeseiaceae bacterium]|nr:hypothetical protein [Woeseiaceae bacterium]
MKRLFRKPGHHSGRAGVARIGSRSAVACVSGGRGDRPKLRAVLGDADQAPNRVSGMPAACVLERDRYRLQLVELPRVEDGELREAMRWQARDLVEFPLEEAVVDVVRVPRHIGAASKPMGYTVVAHSQDVADCLESGRAVSDDIDAVLVVEAALKNLAGLLPQEKHGIALLHFGEDRGYLIISREQTLHLIRRIHHGYDAVTDETDELSLSDDFSADSAADSVSLEIQRSLDYYESHYDCKPIGELVMTPRPDLDDLAQRLRDNLGLDVSPLRFEDHFEFDEPLPERAEESLILAIGAALEQPAGDSSTDADQHINLLPNASKTERPAFSAPFLFKSAAAAVTAMALLGFYASRQVDALKADIDFNQRQEEIVIRQLGQAVETLRVANDADSAALRREDVERDLKQKQALLALLQGDRLGSGDGFSPQLIALSQSDPAGLWLTRISLRATRNHTRLEGFVAQPEVVAEYVQTLTDVEPFARERFQHFSIEQPEEGNRPLAFVLSGQPLNGDQPELLR